MSDWKEIIQNPMLNSLKDCCFYLNSNRLYENDTLGKNTYYIHYVRRMRADNKFWFMWKDSNKTTLILQIFYPIKFKKIFKDPKLKIFENSISGWMPNTWKMKKN
jgi:hypothetical protein